MTDRETVNAIDGKVAKLAWTLMLLVAVLAAGVIVLGTKVKALEEDVKALKEPRSLPAEEKAR